MTDRAWITSGAERSAPRSHLAVSALDVYRVTSTGPHFETSGTRELAGGVLHGNPPHARREAEGRVTGAQRRTFNLFAVGASGAVQRSTQWPRASGAAPQVGETLAESGAQRRSATARIVARRTGARCDGRARRILVEGARVRACAAVCAHHVARVAVERIALGLKDDVQ